MNQLGESTPVSWRDRAAHRQWVIARLSELIRASLGTVIDGGFSYTGVDGQPVAGRTPTPLLTARMTHVAAYASVLGIPGSETLLDHGILSLDRFRDQEFGGWWTSSEGPGRKLSYEHVHLILAGSSALIAYRSGAGAVDPRPMLDNAITTVMSRFWDENSSTVTESLSRDWSGPELYRGANSNMHAVEAFLALGDALDEPVWHERALAISDRIINRHARSADWLIPEHFTHEWEVDWGYNRQTPNDPFRPYGATLGHSFEWARLLCALAASPRVHGASWLTEAAAALARRALSAWRIDGREGLPYTVDWQGAPVSTIRLHWPICEAIQAAAYLHDLTGDPEWERWYRTMWEHAQVTFMDAPGPWLNEIADREREEGGVWPGRPDVYHVAGAYSSALSTAWPFMTQSVSRA